MTDHDFTELLNTARAKGFVARMLHPLVLVITTPEYAATAPALVDETPAEQPLPISSPEAARSQ